MKIKDLFEAPKKAQVLAKKVPPVKKKAEKPIKPVPLGTFTPNPDAAKPNASGSTKNFPVIPTDKSRDAAKKIVNKTGGKKLGTGAFATAYNVPKDMDSVVKISKLNQNAWSADGYYNFIKEIFDKQDNPYLPQIYEVLRMQPKNDSPYLMVNVERLIGANKLTTEELLIVAEKMFGVSNIENLIKKCQYMDNTEHLSNYDISDYISIMLENWARDGRTTPNIVDPQLIEAMKIIRYLHSKEYTIDIHDENFMFRRTPYGPQLVLTDPLAFYRGKVKINTGRPITKKAPRPKGAKEVDLGDDDVDVTATGWSSDGGGWTSERGW